MADPQLRARGLFVTAPDTQRGLPAVTHLRTPLPMWPLPTRPPPALGQHTVEVLREAGLSDAEVAALTPSGR